MATGLPFLKRSGVPERKAQRYMKLAWSGLKSDSVSDLGGIKAALRWMDGLRAPGEGECLLISLDGFSAERKKPLVVVWRDGGSAKFAIFNPRPKDTWIDLLVRPLERTEALLPAIYAALNHRFLEMSFRIVPHDAERVIATDRLAAAVADFKSKEVCT